MRTFWTFCFLFSFFFLTRTAAADPTGPVIIVEIAGDIDDPQALREAIGAELHATAVAPDDPRAGSARGTLSIEARGENKRMSATYRTLGAPVSRTVDLPEDPKRARTVAVLLAGNVARSEADELLAAKTAAPPPATPATASTPTPTPTTDAELARMRSMLGEFSDDARRGRRWRGLTNLGTGALELGLGGYYVGDGGPYWEKAGISFLVLGAFDTVIGIVDLATSHPYERMQREIETDIKNGVAPAKVLANAENRWAHEAAEMETSRKWGGGYALAIGSLTLGLGLARPAILSNSTREREDARVAWALVAVGGFAMVRGVERLLVPSDVEQTWSTYRRMKTLPQRSARKPSFAIAPLPGGATVGFSLTF